MNKVIEYNLAEGKNKIVVDENAWTTDLAVINRMVREHKGDEPVAIMTRTVTTSDPETYSYAVLDYKELLDPAVEALVKANALPAGFDPDNPDDLEIVDRIVITLAPIIGEGIAQVMLKTAQEMYGDYGKEEIFLDKWDKVHDKMSYVRRITGVR